MEKVRPQCGQPSDRGRLKNRTEQNRTLALHGEYDGSVCAAATMQSVAAINKLLQYC